MKFLKATILRYFLGFLAIISFNSTQAQIQDSEMQESTQSTIAKLSSEVYKSVVSGGIGTGLTDLIDGNSDLAMSSRPIKMDERLKLQEAGLAYKQVTIAFDALDVVVNLKNKVSQLISEQLEGIYTGKIINWKDVGCEDLKIVMYSRETSSETYEFFKEHLMNRINYTSNILNMPATDAIIQSVSQTKGVIGLTII